MGRSRSKKAFGSLNEEKENKFVDWLELILFSDETILAINTNESIRPVVTALRCVGNERSSESIYCPLK